MVTELRPPVSESSTRSQIFMPPPPPTDSEQKLHKMGIKNWLPIVITTTLCPMNGGES